MSSIIDLEHTIDREASSERLDELERKLELQMRKDSFLCPSGSVSKELCHYITQIGFSVALLSFSLYNLTYKDTHHDLSVSLISMLTGLYLPQPSMSSEDRS